MTQPVKISTSSSFGGKVSLDLHIPVAGDGKCGCLCWRRVTYEGVVFNEKNLRFEAKESAHMTKEEKIVTRKALSDFILERVENDEKAHAIVCKFIAFNPEDAGTVKIKQLNEIKRILTIADEALNSLRESSSRKSSDPKEKEGKMEIKPL